jgi:hypothetical protein
VTELALAHFGSPCKSLQRRKDNLRKHLRRKRIVSSTRVILKKNNNNNTRTIREYEGRALKRGLRIPPGEPAANTCTTRTYNLYGARSKTLCGRAVQSTQYREGDDAILTFLAEDNKKPL